MKRHPRQSTRVTTRCREVSFLRMTSSSASVVAIQSGTQSIRVESANALLGAIQRHGYCLLAHPRLNAQRLSSMKAVSKSFFKDLYPKLSEFQRESIRSDAGFRGFYRYIGASGRDDAIDCFSIGRDMEDPSPLRRAYFVQTGWEEAEFLPHIGRRNPWEILSAVDAVATQHLRREMVDYYDACHEVAMDVLRHMAFAMGIKPAQNTGIELPDGAIDAEYFVRDHSHRDHNLEAKFYPKMGSVLRSKPLAAVKGASTSNPTGPKVLRRKAALAEPVVTMPSTPTKVPEEAAASLPQIRLDSHSDLSTITILAQDAMGGLEVFDDEKDMFVEAPVLDDAVLINAGTFLERWSGGFIPATPHRVRSAGTDDRCSVVFFCFPNHDAVITPLLEKDDNPALADADDTFTAGDMMPPLIGNAVR